MSAPRPLLLVGAGAVSGCVVGGIVALLQSPGYRATTTLLVQAHGAPVAVPTVATLATGDTVVGNVASAVHRTPSSVRGHLHVSVPNKTALVRLAYDDAHRLAALQIVQEEATVVQAVVASRISGGVRVSVADPPRATRRGRAFGRDLLAGGLLGIVLGGLAGNAPRKIGTRYRRYLVPGWRSAKHAPERLPVVPVAPSPPQAPPPAPAPQPPDLPGRVAQLRTLVDAHGAEYPADQVAEWEGYLVAFAAQEVDGELPPNLDGLARDVFAPLLDRA